MEGSNAIKSYLQSVLDKYSLLQSDGNALMVCGMIYHFAQLAGEQRSYKEASKLYNKAANLGCVPAMNNLGVMYYQDQGVSRDYYRAKNYFEKTAELGDVDAMKILGHVYEQGGYGVLIDITKAARCYRLVAGKREDAIKALQNSKAPVVFSYHAAMQKNEIAKAANLVVEHPLLIKELEEFDCMRINGREARDKVANLIEALEVKEFFENNPNLDRDVKMLNRYIETPPSLVGMAIKTLFNNNIDYSFLPTSFKKSVGLPEQRQKALEEKSLKCVLQ